MTDHTQSQIPRSPSGGEAAVEGPPSCSPGAETAPGAGVAERHCRSSELQRASVPRLRSAPLGNQRSFRFAVGGAS